MARKHYYYNEKTHNADGIYFAFVCLALLGDGSRVFISCRLVEGDRDADTGDANDRHRQQVDDHEQQQEETATKMTQVVESIGADLARRDAVSTVDGERVTVTIEVWRCENERHQPRDRDQFPRPRFAVHHHCTERINNGVVSASQTCKNSK